MNRALCETRSTSSLSGAPSDNWEVLGTSRFGRPLVVHYCGSPGADLRIFVLAGQHGDEGDARDAAADLLARWSNGSRRSGAQLAVVTDANPDGAVAGTRRNARDADLNRDHLFLAEPETSAVHRFVERWRPHLAIDVHTYRPWRKELLAHDLVFTQDVMIDFPTNPAVGTAMGPALQRKALAFVKRHLLQNGIRCERYTLVRDGIVRHSNVDILDARNGLAMRFGVPTVLIEGRRGSPEDTLSFAPSNLALLQAIEGVLEWAIRHSESIAKPYGKIADQVPLRCCYSGSDQQRYMEMQSASSGAVLNARIPGDYLPTAKATKAVQMPDAYGVPFELADMLATLARHRFQTAQRDEFHAARAERYRVDSVIPPEEEDSAPLPVCVREDVPADLDGFAIFPTDQAGGRLLVLMLEPESQFSPHRFPDLGRTLQPGCTYPILRLHSR